MHEVQVGFLNYVKHAHAHLGYEPDPWRLAHHMHLGVKTGPENGLFNRTISITYEDRYSNRAHGVLRHEIAHHLLKISGTEEEILYRQGSHEEGLPTIENLAYHAELVLHIPDSHLIRAHELHGNTPQAIVRIAALAEAPVVTSLHRWVYAEVGAQRAAWITRGRLVTQSAAANLWLPFWRYSEIDDPREDVPNALLHPLCQRETLGMVLGGI